MLFLRKLLICYFKRSCHRQEETLFQASSYCFQRASIDLREENLIISPILPASGLIALVCRTQRCPYLMVVDTTADSLELQSTAPSQKGQCGPRTAMGSLLSSVPTSGHCTGWRSYSSQQKDVLWEKARNCTTANIICCWAKILFLCHKLFVTISFFTSLLPITTQCTFTSYSSLFIPLQNSHY